MPTSEYVCRRNPHGSLHGAAARERAKVRGEGRQCANRASGHSHGCGRCAQQQRYKGRAPHVSQGLCRGDARKFCSRNNFVTPSARSRTSTNSTGPRRPTPDERWRLFARSLRLPAVGARLAAHGAGQQPRRLCAARLPPGFRRARPHTVSSAGGAHPEQKKRVPARANSATQCGSTPPGRAPPPPARRSMEQGPGRERGTSSEGSRGEGASQTCRRNVTRSRPATRSPAPLLWCVQS